jgi:membrane-associated protease RseP (regulator of RpoE activity)
VSDDTPVGDPEPAANPDEPTEASTPDASAPAPDAAPMTAEPAADPTAPQPVTAEPVTAAEPVAAAEPTRGRGGILLPTWVAAVLAVLLIGGVGFAIGYWTGDDNGSDRRDAASAQPLPGNRVPNLPFPNGNGNGNNGGGNNGGGGQTTAQGAFLGVSVENADNNTGARVTGVQAGSPAANAGLKTGDVITKIDDTTVQTDADLIQAIRSHKPGDDVSVTYTRDGNSAQAKVTLGDRSDATRSSVPS